MKMKARIKNIFLIFSLLGMITGCDTFKDEYPSKFSESVKQLDGTWQLKTVTRNGTDITNVMDFSKFHVILKQDSTYTLENYLPFIVKNNGKWKVDDANYPFHLSFTETNSSNAVTSEIQYPIVDGERQISLTLSPGCASNIYTYAFEKISE
jgi:hypothetical protein